MSRPRSSVARSESLREQVVRAIRNDIGAGVLRHGQRLPSSRELAASFDVSVFTINEAMDVLIKEGLVVSKARSARTVNAPDRVDRRASRSSAPQVVMIGGYAGSGKTELGRMLARETGWPILDKDTLTRYVVEAALEMHGLSRDDRKSDTYLTKIRPGEYLSLIEAMTENVQCGNSAIVTAPFLREFTDGAWIEQRQSECKKMGASLTLVWVHCDEESMRTYIRRRNAARDSDKINDWDGYMTGVDVGLRPPAPHVVVSNSVSSDSLEQQAQQLLAGIFDAEKEG